MYPSVFHSRTILNFLLIASDRFVNKVYLQWVKADGWLRPLLIDVGDFTI